MLFGVDTSGKIGQGNLYVAAIEYQKTDILADLRTKVAKRHKALASRRRMKASELNDNEKKWFIDNFSLNYSSSCLSIPVFSQLRCKFMYIKNWRFKILASAIYLTLKNRVKDSDVILLDRDYSEDVMKHLKRCIEFLFSLDNKHDVVVDVGTSFNEVIALADLVAGCSSHRIAKFKELQLREIEDMVRLLK
jgi:hypothetical protein